MKKIFILITAVLFFASCKKGGLLDDRGANALNEQTVFSNSTLTLNFLSRIYADVPFAFFKARWENGGTEQATDDSEYSLLNPARRPLILYTSSYNPDNFPFFTEFWQIPFDNIRRANLLLSKLPATPLPEATKTRAAAEARFLRAWFYHNLVINFGGVPLIGDKVFEATDDINIPRSTFAQCVTYIVSELDAVASILPENYTGNDYGRVTQGAARALKAKMLLFAASPLFNGNVWPSPKGDGRDELAGYPTYDQNRWKAAADAADVIIKSGVYQLNQGSNPGVPGLGFYEVFLKRLQNVKGEYILYHNRAPNRDFESFYLPQSRGGSRYGTPTQNLVDAFPMKNGKAITDPTSGYNPQNPYVNRDPRFNYSIIYNGALYYSTSANAKTPVYTYVGAPTDGLVLNPSAAGPSGYFSRKMLDENLNAGGPGNTDRGWPLIRYAEILLIYAEAINETGQTALAYPVLRELRQRAGIDAGTDGNYGMKPNMTVDEMRAFVQNERRIELMYENQRWDDARRWKIAKNVFNGFNKLMKISGTPTTGFTYEVINSFFRHTFNDNNYILPIPTGEIRKAPSMKQNPGWN